MKAVSVPALFLTSRSHAENGAIIRVLTAGGLRAGYVQGAHSRYRRPLLLAGNYLQASWREKLGRSLPSITLELLHSRARVIGHPLPALFLSWICPFTAAILPEAQPEPYLFQSLKRLLDIVEETAEPLLWMAELVRFELLLLSELGYGLQLSSCVMTGQDDHLEWVSPKHHAAVSQQAAKGYETKLLALPPFLKIPRSVFFCDLPDKNALQQGLKLSGFFLRYHFDAPYYRRFFEVRQRLIRNFMASFEQDVLP
ncbi:MAG: DNA repair protein RecO [Zymomonas mobilis]|uniref:DNA repair protein RecO n=1 Tax=Zymomonas mobilis TaxID=542 RepID=A0A542W0L9_ZYMMB|nr:DNA repair protein RecO [Zymomonas mobilis]TQL17132.1 DNA replication and repair protein RecO [Zymomonas mobilis]